MAETSPLCFSNFSSLPSLSRCRFSNSFIPTRFSVFVPSRTRGVLRFGASNSSGSFPGDDPFGPFPWSDASNQIEWVQEETVTLFTADGLFRIGGTVVPRLLNSSEKKQGKSRTAQRFQRYQESDYMDPSQGLCLAALFDISATNGLDMGRRLCIFGFCRSIEMLSDVVEDTVLGHGGEVVATEKAIKGGMHERLTMSVAVPYLWGVPPASETLRLAVCSGGGIVEKVYWQWDFL